ncbi:hypothetical protein O3G_MSEX006553 [Manduca sexta]|uniref:Carboxypeptidase n=3 Tax=Manduca sexta TaxID=7130 RepID=A0A922CKL3_MANSE|nr:hypothetical protein O3G_MSEX006553 [Manduca sexta]
MGPFEYDAATKKIKARQWSWAKNYSLLFIDNPVGAGFSFTNSKEGFVRDMDSCAGHLYDALRQFVAIFPELKKAPLYIAGESYAGRYLPALGLKIHQQDPLLGKLDVNLQGVIMGNPVLNRDSIANYSAVFQQWGLIDSQGAEAIKPLQDAYYDAIKKENDEKAFEFRNKLLDKLQDMTVQPQMFNILKDDLNGPLTSFIEFVTRPVVKEAIHVGNIEFTFSNGSVHEMLIPDFVSDVSSKVMTLLEHYKILIYCGQLDLTAPCVQNAQARRSHWQWSYREDFLKAPRKPWWYNNSVAGYVKSGGRLTEVLVRGAGHLVPMDKPAQMHNLIDYFIRGFDLPFPPNYIPSPDETPDYFIEDSTEGSTGLTVGLIVSIMFNILLIVSFGAGVIYVLRWKSRTEAYFYSNVDETSISESVLTMS